MEFLKQTKTIGFMGKSKMAMVISIVLVLSSYALLVTKGLHFGVDFAGGTIVQVKYAKEAPIDTMRTQLSTNAMFKGASITEFGSPDEVIIRLKTSSKDISISMKDLIQESLSLIGGRGGGSPMSAQGGGPNTENAEKAISIAYEKIENLL